MSRPWLEGIWAKIRELEKRLQRLVSEGVVTPKAHAASHYDAGGDPVDVTQLAGFPGGTTDFLREDGTFATPGGGSDPPFTVVYELDGGGSDLTTGFTRYIRVPRAGTITKWTLLADVGGSIVIDVWKDTFANYPPTDSDSITGGNEPELSTDDEAEDSTLTGWSTSVSAGDVLGFIVDSVSGGIKWAVLVLEVTP